MKIVKAVAPFNHPGYLNFKKAPYEAWVKIGGQTAKAHYPVRVFHRLAYRGELPSLWLSKKEARLRFVEPVSILFDTFPDYACYEVIPFVWDCWPCYFETMCNWLEKYQIKTAVFTSSQVAAMIKDRFPSMNVLFITEGINIESYNKGEELQNRIIDFLEYGRNIDRVVRYCFDNKNVVRGQNNGNNNLSPGQLSFFLQNSKVVAAYPKSWTNPEQACNIETLTQRYWEGMLSRCVMIGHAPQELIDLIGYNPVIEVDLNNADKQLENILLNIENYQSFVDKNRGVALKLSDWIFRMTKIKEWLCSLGYNC